MKNSISDSTSTPDLFDDSKKGPLKGSEPVASNVDGFHSNKAAPNSSLGRLTPGIRTSSSAAVSSTYEVVDARADNSGDPATSAQPKLVSGKAGAVVNAMESFGDRSDYGEPRKPDATHQETQAGQKRQGFAKSVASKENGEAESPRPVPANSRMQPSSGTSQATANFGSVASVLARLKRSAATPKQQKRVRKDPIPDDGSVALPRDQDARPSKRACRKESQRNVSEFVTAAALPSGLEAIGNIADSSQQTAEARTSVTTPIGITHRDVESTDADASHARRNLESLETGGKPLNQEMVDIPARGVARGLTHTEKSADSCDSGSTRSCALSSSQKSPNTDRTTPNKHNATTQAIPGTLRRAPSLKATPPIVVEGSTLHTALREPRPNRQTVGSKGVADEARDATLKAHEAADGDTIALGASKDSENPANVEETVVACESDTPRSTLPGTTPARPSTHGQKPPDARLLHQALRGQATTHKASKDRVVFRDFKIFVLEVMAKYGTDEVACAVKFRVPSATSNTCTSPWCMAIARPNTGSDTVAFHRSLDPAAHKIVSAVATFHDDPAHANDGFVYAVPYSVIYALRLYDRPASVNATRSGGSIGVSVLAADAPRSRADEKHGGEERSVRACSGRPSPCDSSETPQPSQGSYLALVSSIASLAQAFAQYLNYKE